MEDLDFQTSDTASPSSQIKFKDVFNLTLSRWPWIVLSVVVCLALAGIYLLRKQPVYTRTAEVVIRDDSQGTNAVSQEFSDMGLFTSNSIIEDEMNKLSSPDVMTEVVKRLDLNVSYYAPGQFRKEIVYGPALMVKATFPSLLENASLKVDAKISPKGTYTLSNLKFNKEDGEILTKGPVALGKPVNTSAGPIILSKTPYWRPDNEDMELSIVKASLNSAVRRFGNELTVTRKNELGNTITIEATDQSVQRAEDLINGVISVYNENWIENRNQISVATSKFISDRLGVIEHELGNVDQDISSYQSAHLIPNVQQAASMSMAESQEASSQILELNNQLQMARYLRAYLTNETNRNSVLPANSGVKGENIEAQVTAYNNRLLERNRLAANSSETNPLVIDLDAQLAAQRSAIVSTIDNQIVSLNTQIRNLQNSKNRATAEIAANPTQAKYLLSVERQQKVKESLYLYLLQKREENELSQAFTAYNTQVITKPNGVPDPTSPKTGRVLFIAIVFGLAIPFGITYLQELNNTRVRGRKDLEGINVPFLGEIPQLPGAKKRRKKGDVQDAKIVVESGKRDMLNEAFRVLRTNVGFMASKDKGCCVIMITSFNPGSGKTFVTMNLAIGLALRGKRVLVIDGDLRRASTSIYVNNPKRGLSDYLIGATDDIQSVLQKGSVTNGLDILPVGKLPPNPTELLETERFVSLIRELRHDYDYILIDCPPLDIVADAQIINQVVDRTILVVRAGLLERVMLPRLEQIVATKRFHNLGVVLNGADTKGKRYGAQYGYGYGYGDGYYTQEDKKK